MILWRMTLLHLISETIENKFGDYYESQNNHSMSNLGAL